MMRSLFIATALALANPAGAQGLCPTCVQNTAAPQNAQINIGTATIRGTIAASTGAFTNLSATSLSVTSLLGNGAAITSLNASQLLSGIVSAARVVGSYTGITGVGTLVSGIWNGTPVGTQYGGTGQNFVTAPIGGIPYFSAVGTMTVLSPDTAGKVLQTNGSAAPSWTAAPSVLGTNVLSIPPANLAVGTLPAHVAISSNSLPATIPAASISGNIQGGASFLTAPLPISNLAGGLLPTNNPASSITVTGVSPGTYGGPSQLAQIQVRPDGRIQSISQFVLSVPPPIISTGTLPSGVTIAAAAITSGTLSGGVIASSIAASGVSPGSYGDASRTITAVVQIDGRLSSINQQLIALQPSQISTGALPSGVTIPAAGISTGTLPNSVVASSIVASGVAPGTYGGPSLVPQLVIGSDGRITSAAQFSAPGFSTSTVYGDVANSWTHSQTFQSSVTVSTTVQAAAFVGGTFTGAGGGLSQLVHIDGDVMSGALIVNSSITATSSITASAFFGDGSNLSGVGSAGKLDKVGTSSLTITGAAGSIATQSSVTASAFFGGGTGITSLSGSVIGGTTITFSADVSFLKPVSMSTPLAVASGGTGNSDYTLRTSTNLRTINWNTRDLLGQLEIPMLNWGATGVLVSTNLVVSSSVTVQGDSFSVGGSTLVVSNGRLGIGTSSPNHSIHIVRSSTFPIVALEGHGSSHSPRISGMYSNGTPSVPTAAASGDTLLEINGIGHNGTSFSVNNSSWPAIRFVASETISPTSTGGQLRFFTTPNGSVTHLERARVTGGGDMGINTTSPSTKLDVNGDAQFGSGAAKSTFTTTGDLFTASASSVGIRTSTPTAALEVNGQIVHSLGIVSNGVGNGSTVGSARGTGAIDLQTSRSSANQVASGPFSVIGGGDINRASGDRATVAGGSTNAASGSNATISGGISNTASGSVSTVGGGFSNTATASYTKVGGGTTNSATVTYATVGGGNSNQASATGATVGGGEFNIANGGDAAVAGGTGNTAGQAAAVAGGQSNNASGAFASIGGGLSNEASGAYSHVGGGSSNVASASSSTVLGGGSSAASGAMSIAAGRRAKATAQGSFVWADSQNADLTGTTTDQFLIRAQGGVRFEADSSTFTGGVSVSSITIGSGGFINIGSQNKLVNPTTFTSSVTVSNSILSNSSITASMFFGDGMNITNIAISVSSKPAGTLNIATVSYIGLATATFTAQTGVGHPLNLFAIATLINGSGAPRTYTCRLTRDSVLLNSDFMNTNLGGDSSTVMFLGEDDAVTAGVHNYALLCLSSSAAGTQTATSVIIRAIQF